MSTLHSNLEPEGGQSKPTTLAVVGRLTWMLVGPFALLLSLIDVWGKQGRFGAADILYIAALAAMLVGRWAEFHSGHGLTGSGEPATREDLRRYLLITGTIGAVLWLAITFGRHF